MSFLRRLFGGGGDAESGPAKGHKQIEYRGFIVIATPYKAEGQYQTSGVVTKEVSGVVKEHRFIRADRFAGLQDAIEISLKKGQQIIDEQGERIFEQ